MIFIKRNMKTDKNTKDFGLPTQREIRVFLDSIEDTRDMLMARVLYETGCTIGEMVRIKASDVLGSTIRIAGRQQRFPRVSGRLSKSIRQYKEGNRIQEGHFLFSARHGSGITERRARQILGGLLQKAFSREINPHKIRYCHAAHAYSDGVLLQSIARQLGITSYRAFRIIEEAGIPPAHDYQKFLSKV